MASNSTVIATSVSIDTAAATKSMNELNAAIKESKKALGDAKIGSDEYKKAQSQLKEQEDELQKSLKTANGEKGKSAEAFSVLKEKVQGLVPGLKSAEGGVSSFGSQLKVLAANPIMLALTAIVAVLSFIYEAFNNTSAGAKKTHQIMAGLSAILSGLKDAAFILGRSLFDLVAALFNAEEAARKFLTLDFKGAKESWAAAKENAKDLGKGITDAANLAVSSFSGKRFTEAAKIEQDLQAINKEQRKADEDKILVNQKLLKSRELLTDMDNKDLGAKKKALAEVKEAETKAAEIDEKLAVRRFENKKSLYKMDTDGEKKHAQELSDLNNDIVLKKTEALSIDIKLNKQSKMLSKQGMEDDKAAAAQRKADLLVLKEYEMKKLKLDQELELALISDKKKKEFKILENAYGDEKSALEYSLADKKLKKGEFDVLLEKSKKVYDQKVIALTATQNEEEKQATRKFETELNKLELEIKLAGITDVREKERVQLDISFAEKRKQAEEAYKNDAVKLGQIKAKILEQEQLQKQQLEKKFADEDEKAQGALNLRKIAFEDTVNKNNLLKLRQNLTAKQKEIDRQYAAELAAAKGNAQKIKEIEQKHVEDLYGLSEAKKHIDNEELAHKDILRNSIISIANNLADAIGKNTVVGKGIAVAGAIIDTYAAIAGTLKNVSRSASGAIPGYAIAQAIATGVAGLVTVQKIISVQIPGQSGGSGGASASLPSAPAAPLAPTQTSTRLNAQSIQGVGNAAAQGAGRNFVLDSDIKNSAERQNRLVRAARLGILIFIIGSAYL